MWKLDANGNIVMKDGNPVFTNSSGQEQVVAHDTISRLNAEAKTHRERAEAAEAAAKPFEGLDAAKAREALEVVGKIDQKKLIDSGQVDQVRAQITEQYKGEIAKRDEALNAANNRLNNVLIDNIFANSQFVRNRVAVPTDMFKDSFGKHFKVDEKGEVIAVTKEGARIASKERLGEYASAEEALQILVEARPDKDILLKANTGNGSGNQGGGGGTGAGNVIRRADFEKMTPAKKAEVAGKVNTGEMKLTD